MSTATFPRYSMKSLIWLTLKCNLKQKTLPTSTHWVLLYRQQKFNNTFKGFETALSGGWNNIRHVFPKGLKRQKVRSLLRTSGKENIIKHNKWQPHSIRFVVVLKSLLFEDSSQKSVMKLLSDNMPCLRNVVGIYIVCIIIIFPWGKRIT